MKISIRWHIQIIAFLLIIIPIFALELIGYDSSAGLIRMINLASIVFGSLIGFMLAWMISKPLQHVQKGIGKVAKGDLTEKVAVKTNIKELSRLSSDFDHMLDNLKSLISTTKKNVNKTEETAKKGSNSIQELKEKMNKINETSREGAKKIQALNEKSKEIGGIVETISNMSSQTNLLAINAAIEAARAGDAGKGFAVVASEVRKLAEQSQKATEDISELLTKIQEGIEGSIVSMEENTKQVDDGVRSVNEALASFEEVPKLVRQVNESISSISTTDSKN